MIRKIVFNFLGIVVFLILFFVVAKSCSNTYLIKQQPKQELCGKLIDRYGKSSGKTHSWYWVVGNDEQRITIIEHSQYKHQYEVGDKLCVQYAVDFDLKDYPYVFEIYPPK